MIQSRQLVVSPFASTNEKPDLKGGNLHPELGLRVDRTAHDQTGLAQFLVQVVLEFYDPRRRISY